MKNRIVVALSTLFCLLTVAPARLRADEPAAKMFDRDNLVAWCIVPFDGKNRGPEQRAAMLKRIGIRKLAYDYRAEHVPTFDAEMEALKKHGIELTAWWFPTTLNDRARHILKVLEKHKVKTQLWVMGGGAPKSAEQRQEWIESEARRIRPIAESAAKIGCQVGLYNHGGWFGQPENQIAIIKQLKLDNVGIVYNLHHGHEHLDRFSELLKVMKPHLLALNLNGMKKDGDRQGKKIMPLGAGELDLRLLQVIRSSGFDGPIGILNHTNHDAEARLKDNLDGLKWLVPQLDGASPGVKPIYRTWEGEPADFDTSGLFDRPYDAQLVSRTMADAKKHGVAERGIAVFASAKFACLSCHKIGMHGGSVGPELTAIGKDRKPAQIVESVFWPKREVKPEFEAVAVLTADGRQLQGYLQKTAGPHIAIRDPASGIVTEIARDDIEDQVTRGTLMPNGLAEAMSPQQQLDLIRFLSELGRKEAVAPDVVASVLAHAHAHSPADFEFVRDPLHPEHWPSWQHSVNRDRVFDFYTKQAEHFRKQDPTPMLLSEFPGLDGGKQGHWGNQNEVTWASDRWNNTELGSVQSGIFHGAGVTVGRGVCLQLGERGELSACFNPDTLTYDAIWTGGFVKFSSVRHGFMHGLLIDGKPQPRPKGSKPTEPFVYHGFYRHGRRVIFAYRIGETEYLDAPWSENGVLTRAVAPASEHPLKHLTSAGKPQWPNEIQTSIVAGNNMPYAVDTIELPTQNAWKAQTFVGGLDFLADGSALVCTMQGDVWRVSGLVSKDGESLSGKARWRRFASGLHHALGLVVANGQIYVQCRDQLLRLHDLNNDGEADFYECVSNAFATSAAGHDFICGLQRDAGGNFYTATGNQGLVRISPDGRRADVVATGFRNPDGLGLYPDGVVTVPCSEGAWTPSSMICAVRTPKPNQLNQPIPHFGYRGPQGEKPPSLPLVYLPRGLDNSSGGQAFIDGERWGPLGGRMVHFSFGAGAHFLLLRDEVEGQLQGAVVPLPGEFTSGAHRGRFNPVDGQLYVGGMAGWGSYTPQPGSFQRVRYAGGSVQLPSGFHVYENGVAVTFTEPIDKAVAEDSDNHFAQCWNYRYSGAYGSSEYSARHTGTPGHDSLKIRSSHVLADGTTLFLELPDLQAVNQLHLRMQTGADKSHDMFATVHKMAKPFTNFPGYKPARKTIAPHPILFDMALATQRVPNPWGKPIAGAREIVLETGKNLTFVQRSLKAKAGEPIKLTLSNPDVVPHNWALVKPGELQRVGSLANRLVADPAGYARHYIPKSDDVLAYTDIVPPKSKFTIHFRAPKQPGRYPYLCTFPGHWMVMNGELIVE